MISIPVLLAKNIFFGRVDRSDTSRRTYGLARLERGSMANAEAPYARMSGRRKARGSLFGNELSWLFSLRKPQVNRCIESDITFDHGQFQPRPFNLTGCQIHRQVSASTEAADCYPGAVRSPHLLCMLADPPHDVPHVVVGSREEMTRREAVGDPDGHTVCLFRQCVAERSSVFSKTACEGATMNGDVEWLQVRVRDR
jgi:hypothetical protein